MAGDQGTLGQVEHWDDNGHGGVRGLVIISLGNIAISYHSVISCALVNNI